MTNFIYEKYKLNSEAAFFTYRTEKYFKVYDINVGKSMGK